MNQQPIEKYRHSSFLEVHSIFHTIQGEGPFCGTPAVFIRLAGCNLRCPACDTDYTSNRVQTTPSAILEEVASLAPSGLVVITGGEPFRQDIGPLIERLLNAKYYVQVETNGSLRPSEGRWNRNPAEREGAYLVCSPKTGKINALADHFACAFKYVIEAGNVRDVDGLPLKALQHGANPYVHRPIYRDTPIYVQPMDAHDPEQNQANLQAAIQSCMKHGYILQLQIHKIINME